MTFMCGLTQDKAQRKTIDVLLLRKKEYIHTIDS